MAQPTARQAIAAACATPVPVAGPAAAATAVLYRDALEGVLSFAAASLADLHQLIRVSRTWLAAVSSMHCLNLGMAGNRAVDESDLPRVASSLLGRTHLGQLRVAPTRLDSLALLSDAAQPLGMHLRSLTLDFCTMILPTRAHPCLPSRLTALHLSFLDKKAASDPSQATAWIAYAAQLHHLSLLHLMLVALDPRVSLAPLSRKAKDVASSSTSSSSSSSSSSSLRDLQISTTTKLALSEAQADELRALHWLRSVKLDWNFPSLQRLLRPFQQSQEQDAPLLPALQWEDLGEPNAFRLMDDKIAALLPLVPSLRRLHLLRWTNLPRCASGHPVDDILAGLPALTDLHVCFQEGGKGKGGPSLVQRFMDGLAHCTRLTRLSLVESPQFAFTEAQLTACLKNMPNLQHLQLDLQGVMTRDFSFLSSSPTLAVSLTSLELHCRSERNSLPLPPLAELAHVHVLRSLQRFVLTVKPVSRMHAPQLAAESVAAIKSMFSIPCAANPSLRDFSWREQS
jgi:hypothetical protein